MKNYFSCEKRHIFIHKHTNYNNYKIYMITNLQLNHFLFHKGPGQDLESLLDGPLIR